MLDPVLLKDLEESNLACGGPRNLCGPCSPSALFIRSPPPGTCWTRTPEHPAIQSFIESPLEGSKRRAGSTTADLTIGRKLLRLLSSLKTNFHFRWNLSGSVPPLCGVCSVVGSEEGFTSVSPGPGSSQSQDFTMKSWMCVGLLLVCLRGTWTRFHSLKFFDTLSAELPNVPELAFDWSLDDVPIVHYDSDASSIELKQDWMDRVDLDDPGYWDRKLNETLEIQQIIKADMDFIKEVFGHAGGVFVVQVTYGCEWDNETGVTSSFDNGGYDGEDFLYFDLETETWVAAQPQAAKLKQSLDAIKDVKRKLKEYLTHRCPFWLHRYVEYGSSYVTRTVKHSLKFFLHATSGVQNLPEFVGVAMVDDVVIGSCSNLKTAEPTDWMRKLINDDPQHLEEYHFDCISSQKFFRANLNNLKQRLNQTGGVHILQRMSGCQWDDETGEVTGFSQFGYDGEDFISLDLETLTWVAPKPQAVITKHQWDSDRAELEHTKNFFFQTCPDFLRRYVVYGRSVLQRKVLPSVSLLQKTSSSPVRCLATGFYPKTASLVWRRDGVEIHEDVEHGEILPNQDGTFQMSVDLDVSSVRAEDWGRWDCEFQLSGVKEDMVTRLDRDQIRTNWESSSGSAAAAVVGLVVGLLVLLVFAAGFMAWRRSWFSRSVFQGSSLRIVDHPVTDELTDC
ncbi:uncharacterized protein V6R79_013872 [Siganus canaliculatus]